MFHALGTAKRTGVTASQQMRWEAMGAMGSGSGGLSKNSDFLFERRNERPLSSSELSTYSLSFSLSV